MDILFKNDDFVFSYRVGGILIHDGKILLQRPKNDNYAIIGGHVAAMETSMESLKREFEEEHWGGALSLPLHETDSYEEILDKRKRIILYCQHGGNSMQLARYLGRRGYNVATVIGGYETMKKIRKTI